ncbi:MAG: adenylate/guanylate cyclase domain-containing protein [Aestuariivirga sp.]
MTRRLAAILVADVVGYSRLMEADEAETLAALKERRNTILEPVVREHGGRIVKVMGDGVLIEFASAVNAVKAALELQTKFAAANEVLPEARRIVLRIGINLGDVVGEGSDIYGGGVNIAARLEALAEPGGVCISAKVHEEVRGKIEFVFADMGEQTLKNIALPVRAYSTHPGPPASAAVTPPSSRPSITVLPFINMSGDPEQQYFSDGITEDIITELSRFRTLFVIARNSTFQFRDKAADVRRIGAELGARYVVEGSVRKMGGRIRITAQLIDAAQGNHLWSERFDGSLEDLFEVQDKVTQTIVATVTGRLEDAEIKGAAARRTSSMPAYDCLLRGVELLRGYGAGDNTRARELFERAIGLDPEFALAHAYLALSLLVENHYGQAPQAIKDRALDIALTAVRLDPRDSRCHQYLGLVYRFRGELDPAISHMERSIKLNPNDGIGIASFGALLAVAGRPEEGIDLIRRAMQLNPYHPEFYWGLLASALYAGRRYEECLEANRKIRADKHPLQMARTAACLVRLGRLDEARAVAAEVLQLKPDFSLRAEAPSYRYEADAEHLFDAMRQAGLPE